MKPLTFTQNEWKEKANEFAKEYIKESIIAIEYENKGYAITFWTKKWVVELRSTVKSNIGSGAKDDVIENEMLQRNPTNPITM